MPRDSAGNYTLPAAYNPVVQGEVIESAWANNTMSDIATALTDSLDRNGRGGMSAAFSFVDGTEASPGATWTAETNSGLYRAGSGDMRVSILGSDLFRWVNTSVQVWAGNQWNDVAYSNTGTTVPPGNSDGQTLRWENSDPQGWEFSNAWKITDAGNCVASGTIDAAAYTVSGVPITDIYVPQTTSVIAGQGLINGGTLTSDVTLDVNGGTGITVNASNVALDLTYTDGRYYNVGQQVGDADTVDGWNVSVVATEPQTKDPTTIYFVLSA